MNIFIIFGNSKLILSLFYIKSKSKNFLFTLHKLPDSCNLDDRIFEILLVFKAISKTDSLLYFIN